MRESAWEWLLVAFLSLVQPVYDAGAEHFFAHQFLDQMQERTFSTGREFCGYFGYDKTGKLVATKPNRGREASCRTRRIPRSLDVFASYHSHGTYSPDYENERPSLDDMMSDIEQELDGYIATPGGRVWFVDSSNEVAIQLCGIDCILSDPNFREDPTPPPESLTLRELEEHNEE